MSRVPEWSGTRRSTSCWTARTPRWSPRSCERQWTIPGHQNFYDLTSVLSDHPTDDLVRWAGGLLSSPSIFQVRGAAYALQGMFVSGSRRVSDWRQLVPLLERAWNGAGDDPARRSILAQVCRTLPGDVRAELADAGVVGERRPRSRRSRGRAPAATSTTGSRLRSPTRRAPGSATPTSRCWNAWCSRPSSNPAACAMSTSTWLLASSPFAGALVRAIFEVRDDCPRSGEPRCRAPGRRRPATPAERRARGSRASSTTRTPQLRITPPPSSGEPGSHCPDRVLARRPGRRRVRPSARPSTASGWPAMSDSTKLARDPTLPAVDHARRRTGGCGSGSRILV